jgi:hypothetical protein
VTLSKAGEQVRSTYEAGKDKPVSPGNGPVQVSSAPLLRPNKPPVQPPASPQALASPRQRMTAEMMAASRVSPKVNSPDLPLGGTMPARRGPNTSLLNDRMRSGAGEPAQKMPPLPREHAPDRNLGGTLPARRGPGASLYNERPIGNTGMGQKTPSWSLVQQAVRKEVLDSPQAKPFGDLPGQKAPPPPLAQGKLSGVNAPGRQLGGTLPARKSGGASLFDEFRNAKDLKAPPSRASVSYNGAKDPVPLSSRTLDAPSAALMAQLAQGVRNSRRFSQAEDQSDSSSDEDEAVKAPRPSTWM